MINCSGDILITNIVPFLDIESQIELSKVNRASRKSVVKHLVFENWVAFVLHNEFPISENDNENNFSLYNIRVDEKLNFDVIKGVYDFIADHFLSTPRIRSNRRVSLTLEVKHDKDQRHSPIYHRVKIDKSFLDIFSINISRLRILSHDTVFNIYDIPTKLEVLELKIRKQASCPTIQHFPNTNVCYNLFIQNNPEFLAKVEVAHESGLDDPNCSFRTSINQPYPFSRLHTFMVKMPNRTGFAICDNFPPFNAQSRFEFGTPSFLSSVDLSSAPTSLMMSYIAHVKTPAQMHTMYLNKQDIPFDFGRIGNPRMKILHFGPGSAKRMAYFFSMSKGLDYCSADTLKFDCFFDLSAFCEFVSVDPGILRNIQTIDIQACFCHNVPKVFEPCFHPSNEHIQVRYIEHGVSKTASFISMSQCHLLSDIAATVELQ